MKDQKIQFFRAIAIIAVVMIHTTPAGEWQVFCRPFINFAVAAFIFLSGYLTKADNEDWASFYRRRIMRVAIPYVIWTVIYSIPDIMSTGFSALAKNLLSANANASLYYIFVYIQFVLLTPLISRLARSRFRALGWFIAPVSVLVFRYYGLFTGIGMGKYLSLLWSDLCLGWFTFYYLGLLLGNGILVKRYSLGTLALLYAASILLQMGEGYIWSLYDPVHCGSQLKLSSLLTSSIFMLIIYTLLHHRKFNPQCRIMGMIGDSSFGIYLSHIMFIDALGYLPAYASLPYPLNSLAVLLLSFLFCRIL